MTTNSQVVAKLPFSHALRFIILEGEPAGSTQEAHENGGKDKKFNGRC